VLQQRPRFPSEYGTIDLGKRGSNRGRGGSGGKGEKVATQKRVHKSGLKE